MFEVQSSRGGMPVEIRQRVSAIEAESDNNDTIPPNMISDSGQDSGLGVRSEEGHDVASENRGIEQLRLSHGHEVEFGEVSNQPRGPRMVLLGRGDQLRVDIDANDHVSADRELRCDPSRPATCIEDSRLPPDDGIE